ncbi:hypothetical protein [Halotia branconii]|uniref:Uncharacterized protein n=1 Tax=Halotia branconii CENA392 TaxID=1539056 RepID=A0AAJ6P9G5_9CYAN|nr:hypothetical protein [Halotia branconii]WGV25662.1 hypothetical protein QI031_28745 [Halotia branconii CENA392]
MLQCATHSLLKTTSFKLIFGDHSGRSRYSNAAYFEKLLESV